MRLQPSSLLSASFALAAVTATAACSPKSDNRAATDTAVSVAPANPTTPAGGMGHDSMGAMSGMSHDSMSGMKGGAMGGMGSMANMTGDADRDFLRMMSDHHKGLVEMAHLSVEGDKKGSAGVRADAAKLDKKQDAELDSMQTKLEQKFKDQYEPKVMPNSQAMVDALKGQTGSAYDRAFYQNVVKHHQEAIKMIDEFMPKLKSADVKAMAAQMKRDQTREISEFQQKAAKS